MLRRIAGAIAGAVILGGTAAAQTTAFVNANVVPLDSAQVLSEHTVIVENGVITALGPAEALAPPDGATIIDAAGAWLMPGLADMHAHLHADPGPDFMRLWLAEGITTIRDLNTTPDHLTWRDEVLAGTRVGPTIYLSGPEIIGLPPDLSFMRAIFNALVIAGPAVTFLVLAGLALAVGRVTGLRGPRRLLGGRVLPACGLLLAIGAGVWWSGVIPLNAYTSLQFPYAYVTETEAQARARVRQVKALGFDMAKIYDFMEPAVYLAAIDEAEKIGLYTVGHLEDRVPVEQALDAGLDEIAHVDEFLTYHLAGEMSVFDFKPVPVDMSTVPNSVAVTRAHDVMVVSNLVADENACLYLEGGPAFFDRPEYAALRPSTKAEWLQGRVVAWQKTRDWRRKTAQPLYVELVRQLHAAGVPLLVGTDVSIDGIMPWHLHRDIELLVEAGLSPYDALRAATVNAGLSVSRMGSHDRFGTIATGQRADLILLRRNPLDDVGATRDRIGVMSRGVWYPQERLDALVREFTASY